MEHNNSNTSEYKEKVVHLGKVTKVVKGGRNFRWSALVVVGNENGRVGVGLGKEYYHGSNGRHDDPA